MVKILFAVHFDRFKKGHVHQGAIREESVIVLIIDVLWIKWAEAQMGKSCLRIVYTQDGYF